MIRFPGATKAPPRGVPAGVSSGSHAPRARITSYNVCYTKLLRVAGVVGKSDEDISLEEGFYNQGLDSTNLLQLVKTLEERISHKLYPTLLFEA